MIQYSSKTQSALLKWVDSFATQKKAKSLRDLQDGVILGQMLEQMLEKEFQSSSLIQNPTTREENKQNLETVYRGLARFLRAEDAHLAPSPSEFRAIAENPDDNNLCEFLSSFVTAACLGTLSQTYVPKVMELDQATQSEIAKIIERKNRLKLERAAKQKESEEVTPQDDGEDFLANRDPALMEEELDQLKDKCETLKKQNADLQSRIDKLLDTREAVLHNLRVTQDELTALKRAQGSDASAAIRNQQNEIREKMAEIDRLEDLVERETMRSTRLEKEVDVLRVKAERVKDLQDKVTVLEHETKQQQQLIKGLENYKKKAQDLTIIQQRNRVLDEQIMQLEQDMKDYEDIKALNKKLQKEIDEKSRVLATNEQEIIYTIQARNVMQDTNEELKRRVEYLESKRQLDESKILELEEQLHLGGGGPGAGSESPTGNFSLEQELETSSDPTVALRLEISRLKAENGLLRNNMGVASENERLRYDLENANKKADLYRVQCTEAIERHAIAQEQLNAIANGMTSEKDAAFLNMRKELVAANRELENNKKKMQELETAAADRERELINVKTDLNIIGEEQSSALAALKSSDELISESLRTELDANRKQLAQRQLELDGMKEQLMDALLSKDKIRKQLDDAVAGNNGPASSTSGEGAPKTKKEDAEKMEKLKTALRQKIELLEKSEHEKYEMQRRLKALENGSALAAQKAANDQIIKNLQRENAMITTAWYDLTSRLQSNHVVLQRRHDAPRSWLNKQRQLVNATPRR
ncbi:hypothetical protein QBC37DRAFT_101458 [Rhypophila decipiens]|uniref:Calponin-homology (CH) domain-containing protein n=1 Tax=Rhypophila decipiens TaxID=261697 RepID=A0AAN6YBF1_9PEZI|nr:hypothetical protein QBC37DRAFT_101458 [Rhypophila decipiens]